MTINIVKVGMIISSDADVIVGWRRKKMVDNSEMLNLASNGSRVAEIKVNHIFQKDTKIYTNKKGNIQKKTCTFILQVKSKEADWVSLTQEFDFGNTMNAGPNSEIKVPFLKIPEDCEFREAYIIFKASYTKLDKKDEI